MLELLIASVQKKIMLNVNARKLLSDARKVSVSCDSSKHLVYVIPSNDNYSYSVVRQNSNCSICAYGLVNEFNIKTKVPYEAISYKNGFCFTYEENTIK